MNRQHSILRAILKWTGILVLIFCGFHLLLTGSPVPLFRIEHLSNRVQIARIGDDGLVASDGRLLRVCARRRESVPFLPV